MCNDSKNWVRLPASQSENVDERIRLLTNAAECYQGDLLPTCYADWVLSERERLRTSYAMLLEQLIENLLEQSRAEEALPHTKGLLRFDPLRESAPFMV